MKKKFTIILILCLVIITGCGKKNKLSSDVLDKQSKYKEGIGKTNESKIVVKYINDQKEEVYYVYQLSNNTFLELGYTFHNNKESFDKAIEKYKDNTFYGLKSYEDAYVTVINLERGKNESKEELRDGILNKYKGKKEFEIIK